MNREKTVNFLTKRWSMDSSQLLKFAGPKTSARHIEIITGLFSHTGRFDLNFSHISNPFFVQVKQIIG